MKLRYLKLLSLIGVSFFLVTSCIKNKVTELGDAGSTFIKFIEAPENTLFFSPFTGTVPVDLFSLRKEANGNTELNTATTIKVTSVPGLVTKYNTDHGSSFKILPDSLYTLSNTSIQKAGNDYTVNFSPGDFSKEFTIMLNGSKWDVSQTYALGFVISDPGGKKLSDDMDTVIAFLSIKNKYDGKYTLTGTMTDASSATLTGNYPAEVELRTSGISSVQLYDNAIGGVFHSIRNGADLSYYGAYGIEITFDPVTDKVIKVINIYGQPAGNTRSAGLDPTGVNQWSADTKNLRIKYFMYQPSVVPAAPNIRTSFDENFKYVGPR